METTTLATPARSRATRLALRIGIGLVIAAATLWLAFSLLKNSPPVRRMVGAKLSEMIGRPVTVEDLRYGDSSVEAKLRIGDEIFVETAVLDKSWDQLVRGESPTEITLQNVRVRLAFSKDGELLTALPSQSTTSGDPPRIHLRDATVEMTREGTDDFRVTGISLEVKPGDNNSIITGAIQDPHWGSWVLQGSLKSGQSSFSMTSTDAAIDTDKLRTIPVIPASTWGYVDTFGRAGVAITVKSGSGNVEYEVSIRPEGRGGVTIKEIATRLDRVQGAIRIAGPVINLQECSASIADGNVAIAGRLDFRNRAKINLDIKADKLDLAKLPAEWGLPNEVTGRVRGDAKLTLEEDDKGVLRPYGGGQADVDEATFLGLPAEIRLKLNGDGRRLRFEQESLPQEPEDREPVVYIPARLLVPPAEALPTTLGATITLRDIDLALLLEKLNVTLPMKVAGKATAKLQMAVGAAQAVDGKAWQFNGSLTSKELMVGETKLEEVSLQMRYRAGRLTVQELSAHLPHADGSSGLLRGTASAQLEPRGLLSADLSVQNLPLEQIAKAIPDLKITMQGTADLTLRFQSNVNTIDDPKSWTGSMTLEGRNLKFEKTEIGQFRLTAELDRGLVKAALKKAELFEGQIDGTAEVPLVKELPGSLALAFSEVNSAALTGLIPDFPIPLTGRLSGEITAKTATTDDRRSVSAQVNLKSSKMTIRGIPAEKLTGDVTVRESTAVYSLEGHILGGSFEVKGKYPAAGQDRNSFQMRNLDLSRIAMAYRLEWLKPLQGRIDGHFDFSDSGAGRIQITDLGWSRLPLSRQLSGQLQLRDQVLDLRNFGGDFASGQVRLRSRWDFNEPYRSFYSLQIDRLALQKLEPISPFFFANARGELSLAIRGRPSPAPGAEITLGFSAATLGGFTFSDTRLPLRWSGGLERGSIVLQGGTVHLGHGRITPDIRYDYGFSNRLAGQVRFERVPLHPLLGSAAKAFGNGTITGRLDLSGEAIRSVDDITGTVTATLNQASVREVPLLSILEPYLASVGFLKPFDAGELKGRLSKGIFRIERLSLSNPAAHLFVEGSVGKSGRLDLDVIAVTGQIGPNVRALKLLGVNLTAIGPLPITVITRVGELLSNRMIRFSITGTIDSPQVRINKSALITDNATRFFLGQYVIPETLLGNN